MNFIYSFIIFEAGALCGFFIAALMNAARAGQEITIKFEEGDNGAEREHSVGAENCTGTVFKNEHQAVLRAELSYPVSLGDDARGNITRLDNAILSSSILQKNPIRVSLSVSVTSCSPPAIPKRPADIVDEDKRTRYTEDGSGIRSNP